MATQVSVPIRLVKCPRCRKLLQELPAVPVYQCGGCGTVLQAKVQKPETKHTELPSQETDSVGEGLHDNVLEQSEGGSSNLGDSPKVECSPDDDGSVNLSQNRGASDSLSCSSDIISAQSESSPSKDQESLVNIPLIRTPQKCRSKSGERGEWTASSNASNELPSLGDISLGAEIYLSEDSEHVEQHDQSRLHLDYSLERTQSGESKRMWTEGDNHVNEVQNLSEYKDHESIYPRRFKDNKVVPENEEMMRTFLTEQNGESCDEIKHFEPDSPSGVISHENGIISPSAEVVHDGSKDVPGFRSLITEKSTSSKPSVGAPRSPSKGSLVSFYLTSDDEQLDHYPREVAHKFERFSSMDTSELNLGRRSAAYYPTSRSYYAYDGSEYSYDGIDDQVREHIPHPSRKDKDVGHTRTREEVGRDGHSEADWTYHAMHRPRNRIKSTEVNSYTARNAMRLDAREDVSRLQFPSDHANGRRPAGISGDHRHNMLPPRPAFNLSDKSAYSDPEKVDLLMTVCHLKDQLQRMHFNPRPYNLVAPEKDMYADVKHQDRYNRRRDYANGFGEGYNEPRMAFSGEAPHFRHQAICSCLHCSSQDRHYSAQLPSCSMHHINGHRAMHTDYNCCNRSNSSSPHRCANSEPSPWGCEARPDNQRFDEIKRLQLREKYNTGKRHLRPIAGGAPVITCYHCSELLQLPVDFLLFNKKYHQLMCNACLKVLKFSFHNGTRLVPYVADASAPPPSEAGDYNDAASHGRRNVRPVASHSISCQHVESLSCSHDFGRSFCRSCSTEVGELPLVSSSLGRSKRDSYSRKTSFGKHKGISTEPRMKNEGSVESSKSVGPSMNATSTVSEIEELPPLANSPLHRLMGYSTPSKVFER